MQDKCKKCKSFFRVKIQNAKNAAKCSRNAAEMQDKSYCCKIIANFWQFFCKLVCMFLHFLHFNFSYKDCNLIFWGPFFSCIIFCFFFQIIFFLLFSRKRQQPDHTVITLTNLHAVEPKAPNCNNPNCNKKGNLSHLLQASKPSVLLQEE